MSRSAQRIHDGLLVHSLFSNGTDSEPEEQQYENLTPTAENDDSVSTSLNQVMDTFEEVHMASLVTCVLF